MKMYFSDGCFRVSSTYDERELPKKAGCRWDPAQRRWWTADVAVAEKLSKYADEATLAAITTVRDTHTATVAASRATTTTIDVPHPAGLEYMPFQRAGIAYALARKNTLIADEMGLGKTIQALGVINSTLPASVLIICPASLKINWLREAEKWLVKKYKIEIANSVFPSAETEIVICNYDVLAKFPIEIAARTWTLVIYDESHYLKNPKAKRTIEGLKIPSERKLFLTGTPVLNRPIELHPILRAAHVDFAQNWKFFVTQYCAGKQSRWGWKTNGASNLNELGEKLRMTIMVRREKSQVLTELPPKIKQIIEIPDNGATPEVAAEKRAWDDYQEKIKSARAKLVELRNRGVPTNDSDYKNAIMEMRACWADFAEITKLRHATALKKVYHVVDATVETVASSGCVVVFAHHRDVIESIVAGVKATGLTVEMVTGETALEERQRIVDDFQAGKIQVFVGSIRACGVGITLTKSSNVIFAELDWTPAAMDQAEDRTHRIGQAESVLVQVLVFEGSIDGMLAKKLVAKAGIIDGIME